MMETTDSIRQLESKMKKTTMIMTKTISIVILALVLFAPLKAADAITILTYNISFPIKEETKEFSQDSASFLGVALEYRAFFRPNISLGAYVGWHVFNGETTKTVHVDTEGGDGLKADITGTQFRYINSFPLMLTLNYHIGNPGGAQVYLGLGAGTMIIEEKVELGIVAAKHTRWHLAIAPELGLKIPFGDGISGIMSARYHYAFPAERITGEKYGHSYLSLNVGFSWDHYFFF
jgi:outer membrane protein